MPDSAIIVLMTRLAADVLMAYRSDKDFKSEIERRIKEMVLPPEIELPLIFTKMADQLLDAWRGE